MNDNINPQTILIRDLDSQLLNDIIKNPLKEKNIQHLTLRKQSNLKKIIIQRQKRIYGLKSNDINNTQNGTPSNIYYFFEESEIIPYQKINSISVDYNVLINALNSDNFDFIKWAIFSIRRFFEIGKKILLNEYETIFNYNFEKYFLLLLNKYSNDKYIANEIFFIISNLFCDDLIIINYPDKYFEIYLFNNEFNTIYSKWLCSNDSQIIESVIILFRNILCGKTNFIKKFISNKKMTENILKIENNTEFSIKMLNSLVSFFYMIISQLKGEALLENDIINILNIINGLFYIYKIIEVQKKEIKVITFEIINKILLIIRTIFNFKDNEQEYFIIDYLFEKKNNINFIHYFINSLLKYIECYLGDPDLFFLILDILYSITNFSKSLDIKTLINWGILEFYNEIFNEKHEKILMFYDKNKLIGKLIKIINEIVDSEKENAKIVILSKCFEKFLIYFRDNMANNYICDIYLKLFFRLINYYDKEIAEIMYQRGIIKEAIIYFLLYKNFENNNQDINDRCCIIISAYLEIKYDHEKKGNEFNESDYKICESFKDIIRYRELDLSENLIECLKNKVYMNYNKNLIDNEK